MGLLDDSEPLLRQKLPKVYGLLGGLLGTAPDEMQTYGSILDPQVAARADAVRSGASIGFPIATALNVLPAAGGIFSKFVGSAGGYPSLLKQMGAIDPKGQKQLVEGLLNKTNPERYRLGDIKPHQAADAYVAGGSPVGQSLDVFASPEILEDHARLVRMVEDKYTAPEVGLYAKQAMRPDSAVIPPATKKDYPLLRSQTMVDPVTGKTYNAEMALKPVDDGFEAITIIPQGLPARKKP